MKRGTDKEKKTLLLYIRPVDQTTNARGLLTVSRSRGTSCSVVRRSSVSRLWRDDCKSCCTASSSSWCLRRGTRKRSAFITHTHTCVVRTLSPVHTVCGVASHRVALTRVSAPENQTNLISTRRHVRDAFGVNGALRHDRHTWRSCPYFLCCCVLRLMLSQTGYKF